MVRYTLSHADIKYIYDDPQFLTGEREIPSNSTIFVNILERPDNFCFKVKLIFHSGETMEGYIFNNGSTIQLTNKDELFDGRFNI